MAKISITKTLVEKNPQLAELLAEKDIAVGSKIEQSELDELYKILETTELIELTQEHFDAQPGLAAKGLEVGQIVRLNKKVEEQGVNNDTLSNPSYVVISRFVDKHNKSKIFEVGEVVPAEFEEERLSDLLERKLIKLA
jgi:hypothetical protein